MTDAESEDLPAVSNEQVVGMRERGYVALSNARIREISGHSKLMWFLPAFVLVLALVSIALWKDPSERPLAQFWALMAIAVAAAIPLVSHCRPRRASPLTPFRSAHGTVSNDTRSLHQNVARASFAGGPIGRRRVR
jgi:hypothetical protein